jgi:hypothetical protein
MDAWSYFPVSDPAPKVRERLQLSLLALFLTVLYVAVYSEQLNVGIGTLAGSTIMLLTMPWFLSILGGRVNLDPKTRLPNYKGSPKLDPGNSDLFNSGVTISKMVHMEAYTSNGDPAKSRAAGDSYRGWAACQRGSRAILFDGLFKMVRC